MRSFSPPGNYWGPGRDALGLSHLTYQTSRRYFLHYLDLPPFPCALNVPLYPWLVNWRFKPHKIYRFADPSHQDFPVSPRGSPLSLITSSNHLRMKRLPGTAPCPTVFASLSLPRRKSFRPSSLLFKMCKVLHIFRVCQHSVSLVPILLEI
jgi:hypothetical protein